MLPDMYNAMLGKHRNSWIHKLEIAARTFCISVSLFFLENASVREERFRFRLDWREMAGVSSPYIYVTSKSTKRV